MSSTDDDPVIASYDIVLTDSDISRYVFQYLDRPAKLPYNARRGQKPTSLRMKPGTGMVEIEVPIQTRGTYDVTKGLKYGDAMKKSRANRDGGAFGMAGGFSSGSLASGGGRVKPEGSGDVEVLDNRKMVDPSSLVTTQALGGRIKPQEEGDPVYMLATFKGSECAVIRVSVTRTLTAIPRKPAPLPCLCGCPITPPASPPRCAGRSSEGSWLQGQERRRRSPG